MRISYKDVLERELSLRSNSQTLDIDIQALKQKLQEVLEENNLPVDDIPIAVLSGSLSRKSGLSYSDIDLECLSDSIEHWETVFYWNGMLCTVFIFSFKSFKQEMQSTVYRAWRIPFIEDSIVLWNTDTRYQQVISEPLAIDSSFDESLDVAFRRTIEYRRKILNWHLGNKSPAFLMYCVSCFLESYLSIKQAKLYGKITSEKMLLSEPILQFSEPINILEVVRDYACGNTSPLKSTLSNCLLELQKIL